VTDPDLAIVPAPTTEFVWPIRVYYEDTDASGVSYHASYLRWFERARTEWLRARGLSQEKLRVEHGVAFTVANLEIDYVIPARLDDEVEVVTRIADMRRVSMKFSQELRRRGDPSQVLSRARVRAACVDAATFKPAAMPVGLR
jgi:acyl-CoA thioester hydrolase